jgi:sulfite reductase alpha subunit-like flavoprotein
LDITATPNHVFYEVLYDSFCEQITTTPNPTLTDEQETIRDKLKLLASFSPEGVEERLRYSGRERMSIYEVLFDFKNANVRMPSLERLVECIPKISPRYYSVCNRIVSRRRNFFRPTFHYIPFVDVEICVGLVEYTTLYGRHREGLTSRFFKTLCPGDVVSGTVRLERGFSSELPHRIENVSNLILVGPGTGIAPCRAIIQEYGNSGKKILLLTCFRNPKTDFLFGTDIQNGWGSESVSTIVAWSRPDTMDRGLNYSWNEWMGKNCDVGPGANEGRKTWVQDLIPLFKNKLQGMMMKGEGLIIICGRSHPMPQQVTDELVGINKNLDIVYDTWG